jgi:hypothetical protein
MRLAVIDETTNPPGHSVHSDEDTVQLALAAAEAIKRLVAERAALRNLLAAKEAEVARLRGHIAKIRDSYGRLANELASQIELVDRLEGEVRQETMGLVEFPHFMRQKPGER